MARTSILQPSQTEVVGTLQTYHLQWASEGVGGSDVGQSHAINPWDLSSRYQNWTELQDIQPVLQTCLAVEGIWCQK